MSKQDATVMPNFWSGSSSKRKSEVSWVRGSHLLQLKFSELRRVKRLAELFLGVLLDAAVPWADPLLPLE